MRSAFYELRMYRVERGRMAHMRERWCNDLGRLFERHGVTPLGAWEAASGPQLPLFVYLMHWPDWATRQRAWEGFYADPQWAEARARTNAGSELVEGFELNFLSEILPWRAVPEAADVYLWLPEVDIGRGVAARDLITRELPAAAAESGCQVLGAMEFLTGERLPKVAVFLHPGAGRGKGVEAVLECAPLGRAVRYGLKRI